ncbi:membrane protein insertase YidC [Akkermansiaceae bacterium]|nr:membrane protein insertase YidC [Akkermansiaceae bacterium]MDB4544766.1 membrane protein insertase YidC [Akkermansiaceae bacterium]
MDRKAWIVVTICSILLVFNIISGRKNAAELAKEEAAEKKAQEAAAANTPEEPTGVLDASDKPKEPVIEVTGKDESHDFFTPEISFHLSSLEGGIRSVEFLNELSVHDPNLKVRMNDLGINRIGALTTISGDVLDKPFYSVLKSSEDSITYIGTTTNNLTVKKTWTKVKEGAGSDYRLTLRLELGNPKENITDIDLGEMALAAGSAAPVFEGERPNYLTFFWKEGDDYDSEAGTYFEGGFFSKEKSEYREAKEEQVKFSGVENQFFATIVSPKDPYPATVRVSPKKITLRPPRAIEEQGATLLNNYLSLPNETLAAGNVKTIEFDIFIGPKNNALIRSLDGEKAEVMDYGFFGGISNLLNWTLNKLSNLFGGEGNDWSWGWAVVVLTLIIRTLMWPLHAKSTRTMKRMSKLQPKMAKLKEKYADDPNKMNQETMKLYREFGVNPMGGCLPMFLQIPIFFGFFTMLQYAVELRNEPFLWWITDLSQPDTVGDFMGFPINPLPFLMAITMVLQMKVTPKTGDKMQQRIFMLMPIIFFFFCYNFASALALYWTTQNIFSIGQTWLMQKMPEPELKTNKNAGKKSWVQKLAEKAEAAQKAREGGQGRPAPGGQTPQKPKKPRGPKTGG